VQEETNFTRRAIIIDERKEWLYSSSCNV